MLQLTRIEQVLTQGLKPVPLQSSGDTSRLVQPVSILLLADNGVALSTVYSDLGSLTIDDIKVYLLLVYNYFKNIDDGSDWGLLHVDKDLRIAIQQVKAGLEIVKSKNDGFFVVILYNKDMTDSIAKFKLDELAKQMQRGLEGY